MIIACLSLWSTDFNSGLLSWLKSSSKLERVASQDRMQMTCLKCRLRGQVAGQLHPQEITSQDENRLGFPFTVTEKSWAVWSRDHSTIVSSLT